MKPYLLLISIFLSTYPLRAQVVNQSNTYAIIIGVSQYLDPEIRQLQFANRDAVAFAEYLMSASGGLVPKQNIRLLTDADATIGEVDKALRWVLSACGPADRVYFYFSGHGEVENVTMSKNGYLICYNTPAVAFVNMGLSIDYLNDVVNTLSVQSKANVIVITDACHSGTMAGNQFKGNLFVGEQLMLKKQNEIRMASSKPDQLSNEKIDWGGGRGVFSYYLLNGLQGGLADANQDKTVNVGELKNYLEHKMQNDPVLTTNGDVQTPVINGNSDFLLSKVVDTEAVKIQEQVKNDSTSMMLMMREMETANEITDPDLYFFDLLKKQNLESVSDSLALHLLATDDIAFRLIGWLKTRPLSDEGLSKLIELESVLKKDQEQYNRFKVDLASSFTDIGQSVIAAYINGDEAELERRRYYNSKKNNYDVYVRMFDVAYKLSQTDPYYNKKAAVFLHYFSGLALRIKIPLTEKPATLIAQAMAEQKKALALIENAAYIYNELGYLNKYNNNYTEAEKYFILASQYSPQWSIPLANLCALYSATGKYEKAIAACLAADSLKKRSHTVSISLGLINEKKQNYLAAEEYYYQAIGINARHYLPYERLGYLNISTSNYAIADSLFYEAEQRKKGFYFKRNKAHILQDSDGDGVTDQFDNCMDPDENKMDIFRLFKKGMDAFESGKDSLAEQVFNQVITLDNSNPLVFHYLGRLFAKQKKWISADVVFKQAITNFLDTLHFRQYVDSIVKKTGVTNCAVDYFKSKQYNRLDDYYFIGTVLENWQHYDEAEQTFKTIIELDPSGVVGYLKLWQLLEKLGRYQDAERVIVAYGRVNHVQSQFELHAFYRRVIAKFPEDGNWYYKLGSLLYGRAAMKAIAPYLDTIIRFPVLNKEIFIDFEYYYKINTTDSLSLEGKSINQIAYKDLYIPRENFELVTGEIIELADHIYLPRKDCVLFLKRAAELLSEKETLADIYAKIGYVYVWAGSKEQAYPYFEKSITLIPGNANTRLTMIDLYRALFKNKAAFEQLDYLFENKQINYEKLVLFAKLNLYAGSFSKAEQLIKQAAGIYPYQSPTINNLNGLSGMLSNKPEEAILAYSKNCTGTMEDPWHNHYSIARLYAKQGNTTQAWKYLNSAVNLGFNYSFVLQNDSYLDRLRKSVKWKTMINRIPMKTYSKE